MKFTKKERNEIYKKALDIHLELEQFSSAFLCPQLRRVCGDPQIILEIELPEFDLFHPEYCYVWFDKENGYPMPYYSQEIKEAQRMILLFCIEITN